MNRLPVAASPTLSSIVCAVVTRAAESVDAVAAADVTMQTDIPASLPGRGSTVSSTGRPAAAGPQLANG